MPTIDITEAERIRKKGQQLKDQRDSKWIPKWKQQRDYLAPNDGQFEGDQHNDGKRRDQRVNTKKQVRAAQIAGAGMSSGMASQARPWFSLQAPEGIPRTNAVARWLYQVEVAMRDTLAKTNLYNILPIAFRSQAVYGTAAIAALPHPQDTVRFYHYPTGTYALDVSSDGVVDTFYREYCMTPRQMAQQFGIENLSPTTKEQAERGSMVNVTICHLIEPNSDADSRKLGKGSKRWKSTYWQSGSNDGLVLRSSGFDNFPIMAPRWDVNGTNVYGDGPGDVALGKAQELQLLEADKMRVLQQYARPTVAAPISSRGQNAQLVPGGVVWVPDNQMGSSAWRPVYTPDPAVLPNMRAEIDSCIREIDEAFYVDLFLLISQSEGTMTATEVNLRKEEKMLMLGPVVERNNDELFDPIMDQVFSIMLEQSTPRWMGLLPGEPLIPEPPDELRGVPLTIEYVSILAQAQKAVAVNSIERAIQFTALLVQSGDQFAFDAIDTTEAQAKYVEAIGAPPTMIRGPEQIAAIREARNAQAAQQQQMQQGMAVIDGAKTLAETPTGGDTALSALLGTA